MMRGMFAAISGLKQHQVMLDVTANDIANFNTIGYKSARVTFADSLTQMQRGGSYVAHIPAAKAYGDNPPQGAPIPPGADLIFEIQLIDFMPNAEFEQRVQMIQQLLAQQQMLGPRDGAPGQPQGAPQGAPPPAQ